MKKQCFVDYNQLKYHRCSESGTPETKRHLLQNWFNWKYDQIKDKIWTEDDTTGRKIFRDRNKLSHTDLSRTSICLTIAQYGRTYDITYQSNVFNRAIQDQRWCLHVDSLIYSSNKDNPVEIKGACFRGRTFSIRLYHCQVCKYFIRGKTSEQRISCCDRKKAGTINSQLLSFYGILRQSGALGSL